MSMYNAAIRERSVIYPALAASFACVAVLIGLILPRYYRISHDDILGRMKAREEG